jgi:hypothetical protein
MKGLPLAFVLVFTQAIAGPAAQAQLALPAAFETTAAGTQPRTRPPRRLVRGDVSAHVGWYTVNKHRFDSYNDWLGDSVFGSLGAGWYWTDHVKTDFQFGASSEVRLYTNSAILVAGRQWFVPSEYKFSTQRVSLGQIYQFGRNEWFHPYAGGGLDVVWERTWREDQQVHDYDPVTRQSILVRNRLTYPSETDVEARAFGSAGFKGYLSRRAFFLLDGRVTFARRVDEVILRIGFGADF